MALLSSIDVLPKSLRERKISYQETKKGVAMLAQYMRSKAFQEGHITIVNRLLAKKYHISPEGLTGRLEELSSEELMELGEHILDCDSFEGIQRWIRQKKQTHSEQQAEERNEIIQIMVGARLTHHHRSTHSPPDPVSEEERGRLAETLGKAPGRPLSEIIISEREQ
ncbi:MAG: hypothetical protein DRI57_03815 [Deltaproteobacteria bacterium]|nr:MAG: hypothetical protein DRI57_03815 [Deltaproteobacteria bacterium]